MNRIYTMGWEENWLESFSASSVILVKLWMLWATVKNSNQQQIPKSERSQKEQRWLQSGVSIWITLWCHRARCITLMPKIVKAGRAFISVFIWNMTLWEGKTFAKSTSCFLIYVHLGVSLFVWYGFGLNKAYSFGDYCCGFDLFSLSDPGEIVPGNSFLWRVIYGKCEGCWPLLHHSN